MKMHHLEERNEVRRANPWWNQRK